MNTFRLRSFFVLLLVGLSANAAASSQGTPATSAIDSQSKAPKDGAAETEQISGTAQRQLPSIMTEEEIPAFLLTDPCDSGDS